MSNEIKVKVSFDISDLNEIKIKTEYDFKNEAQNFSLQVIKLQEDATKQALKKLGFLLPEELREIKTLLGNLESCLEISLTNNAMLKEKAGCLYHDYDIKSDDEYFETLQGQVRRVLNKINNRFL